MLPNYRRQYRQSMESRQKVYVKQKTVGLHRKSHCFLLTLFLNSVTMLDKTNKQGHIMSLSDLKPNTEAIISDINGDARFISRITSIGLTPGCRVTVIKNDKNRPVLMYSRDTMIAVNRRECADIRVSEINA